MIKAIAIDDEPPALKIIEAFCRTIDFIILEKTFNKPNEALRYLEENPIDLLFLDVNMPALNGIEFYKHVRQSTMVIFTTAYNEYAVEGFNLSAIDYLLKPFTRERFDESVQKAVDYYQYQHARVTHERQCIYIRADYRLHRITTDDILLVEGMDDYLKIHLVDAKPLVARMTFKVMLSKLPEGDFIRVHRSFIIPFHRIDSVRNKVVRVSGREVPIGASYEDSLMRRLNP